MASGVPIIASDLPSLREVLNNKNAYFVEPNSPSALASEIKALLSNETTYEQAKVKSRQAALDVIQYSYEKRAGKIFNFMLELDK